MNFFAILEKKHFYSEYVWVNMHKIKYLVVYNM